MRTFALALTLLSSTAASAFAQKHSHDPTDEIRPFAGAFVPRGAERAEFRSAMMVGVHLAAELTSHLHGVAGLSWTRSHNRMLAKEQTHIWHYDAGLEFNAMRDFGLGWYFQPFFGVGFGGRTYDYTDPVARNTSCVAAYGSVGAEIKRKLVAVRAEIRDYLSCYEPPLSTDRRARNDLALTIGLAFHRP